MKKKEELYLIIKPIIEKVFGIKLKLHHIYKIYDNKIWLKFYKQSINVDGQRVLLNTDVEVNLCDDPELLLKGKYDIKTTDSFPMKLFSGSFLFLKPYLATGNYTLIYKPWYCEEKKSSYFYKNQSGMFSEHINSSPKKRYKDDSISTPKIKKMI